MRRWLLAGLLVMLSISGCEYEEKTRETGYKGKARVNPWLAAERFCERMGYDVVSAPSWQEPDWADAVWVIPASVPSNSPFVRILEDWVKDGGHLILLLEHTDAQTDDWSRKSAREELPPPLMEMCRRMGMRITPEKATTKVVRFDGKEYQVDANANYVVETGEGDDGVFASKNIQDGRITVVCDGRLFRNRWIGEHEHASLLESLIDATGEDGSIGFLRGAGLSLWEMLEESLWPVMVGLGVLTVLWLWKNFVRFGPVETGVEPAVLRGYDHHLEALGNFQWRLDKADSLLSPLRAQVSDAAHRACSRSGRQEAEMTAFLSTRSGLAPDRIQAALQHSAPTDSGALTRIAADLQTLLHSLY